MDWIQTLSILATVIASAYYIHREIQMDIRSVREEMKSQNSRTDRLYEMYCEMQKEIAQVQKEMSQKFYDLLKEGRK